MATHTESLVELISRLSPEKQAAVREFIGFIEGGDSNPKDTPFQAAVKEFAAAHPELLRRLAE